MSKEAEEFEGNLLDLNNKKATDRYLMDRYEFAQAYANEMNKKKYTKDDAIELIVGYASSNFGVAKDIIRLGARSYVESQTLKQIDHE